jgi:hypothetical protein
VRACSPLSRYVWMEMIGLMFEAEPYGHLVLAGRPVDNSTLARLIGMELGDVRQAVRELEANRVFSRTDDGVIYSRRMLRGEKLSQKRAESGAKGGRKSGRWKDTSEFENIEENSENISKSISKRSSKKSAPEARSQSNPLPPTGKDGQPYAFAGEHIRLNRADFDKWRSAYHAIPDFEAELASIDEWLGSEAGASVRARWFNAVPRMLQRKHDERAAQAPNSPAATAALLRGLPERTLTRDEAQALMTPDEFSRWCTRNGINPAAAA